MKTPLVVSGGKFENVTLKLVSPTTFYMGASQIIRKNIFHGDFKLPTTLTSRKNSSVG